MSRWFFLCVSVALLAAGALNAQPQPGPGAQSPQSTNTPTASVPGSQPEGKKPVMETASMRLASARNILIVRTHGSTIPLEVIRSTLEGWGRFTLVESPAKADLLIEISSTGDSGVQVSSSSTVSPENGHEEKSNSTRRDISPTGVTMTVLDAHTRRPLWSASQSVKFAMKEKSKENNLVEASEKLASKFHERLEPSAK